MEDSTIAAADTIEATAGSLGIFDVVHLRSHVFTKGDLCV